ncbi:hypothetical protein [Clostridium weizhouense]|uniref:Uncharacterized protein n=1 Tax=Clostridium weizhouense TaxID=2859781 RepID=A0ABS7AM55_9CLOT|nr:hypothetical protein [Clostridium weizhouense]MBW6409654.1 hypothetical protein [Clostridium weizhouense]
MPNSIGIFKIYPESFRANLYTRHPFRMIGLIDVDIIYIDTIERVTLSFFRSSGTNSGKIKGLWYPIVGIKTHTGIFREFTRYINYVLTNTTKNGVAGEGWLAKSLFFDKKDLDTSKIRGFSSGMHYKSLLWIGETLRDLYEKGKFEEMYSLDAKKLNSIITSKDIYEGNKRSQRENFEKIIEDIFKKYN